MMIAAFKAGFAFSRAGVGNVHAIAHTLGGLYNTPHGLANAVILPIVLEDYGEAVYPKLARLCEIAGVKTDGPDAEKAQAFIAEIHAMNERMGILKGFDFIQEADIPQIVTWALAEANPNYPVPVVYNAARCRKVIDTIRARPRGEPAGRGRQDWVIGKPASRSRAKRAFAFGRLMRPAALLLPMPPWSTKRQKRLSGCADTMR